MKILRINGFHELPKDFQGSLVDALRLWADAIEKSKSGQETEIHLNPNLSSWAFTWNQERGKKTLCEGQVWEFTESGEWKFLCGAPENSHKEGSVFIQ